MTLLLAGLVAVLLGAAPSVASATEPASTYDAPGQQHNDKCVQLGPALSLIDLRYLGGQPTGFQLSNALAFTGSGGCSTGQIRLDLHEIVSVPSTIDGVANPFVRTGDKLVFHRGGSGYADAQNVRYGQLAVSQLTRLPKPVPSGANRGARCKTVIGTAYKVSVQPIPQDMKYKSPAQTAGNNAGASYLHYGDPAAQQGDQDPQKYSTDPTKQIHYSTLTWSWIDVAGGGHNRILLGAGQDIRLCDVDPILHDSWAPSSLAPGGQVNGWVEARYVQTRVGDGKPLYGWMVWRHHYDGDGPNVVVDHFSMA